MLWKVCGLRVKKRYLIIWKSDCDASGVELLKESIMEGFGIYGLSRTRIFPVYKKGCYEVVGVSREGVEIIRASLAIRNYEKIVIVRVVGTSRRARRIVDSMWKD